MGYEDLNKPEVLEIAEKMGIPGASKLTKDELIASITQVEQLQSNAAPVLGSPSDPQLAHLLVTLGMRTVNFTTQKQVQVGEDDMGRGEVEIRDIEDEREELSGDLTAEEAQQLEEAFGKQEWVWSKSKERFCCVVSDGMKKRRFMITETIQKVL